MNDDERKKTWFSSTVIISVGSIIFSLIAIVVSIRSCSISEKALNLTTEDFIASRSAIYRGTINKSNDKLFLSTIDTNIQLQCAAVHLPPQLDKDKWNISQPDFMLSLVIIRGYIEGYLEKNVLRETGYVKIFDQTSIPIIIGSSYIAKGQSYSDLSLYQLVYTAVVSDEINKRPEVTFKGLIFRERLPSNTDPKVYLKSLWTNSENK
ncbi:MAG: hypothetical protein CVV44_09095 [Spirochaetae bacterium HGW-Spirochaetae-1]|jgi:hypothetical protein|nr:MAG: hypothetical protein CVV44_09095 [Spirochaetae bacterium HGW-Spirochaetae-1]